MCPGGICKFCPICSNWFSWCINSGYSFYGGGVVRLPNRLQHWRRMDARMFGLWHLIIIISKWQMDQYVFLLMDYPLDEIWYLCGHVDFVMPVCWFYLYITWRLKLVQCMDLSCTLGPLSTPSNPHQACLHKYRRYRLCVWSLSLFCLEFHVWYHLFLLCLFVNLVLSTYRFTLTFFVFLYLEL